MNFVGTTTYEGTKKDADELYSMFKDDLAKCTSSFEWAHIREGKMIFIANVTDEEKFYALFEDQRSKDWNAKFNAKDEAWKLEKKIIEDFGSVEKFKDQFKQAGITQFGSGWCWLSLNNDKLVVTKTANAANPLIDNLKPILGCDVWEHSYYIDYRNRRPEYLDKFVDNLIDWEFVESLLI